MGGWWCGFTDLRPIRSGDGRGIHILLTFIHEWSKKEELAVRKGFDPGSPMGRNLMDIGPLWMQLAFLGIQGLRPLV